MAVTALQRPDFRPVSESRRRHLAALEGLFKQVLRLCQRARRVKLDHVALDEVKANASKRKAMSYERMLQGEAQLAAEVKRWFAEAAAADTRDDDQEGRDRRGDELPAWVVDKQKRLEKIAKRALRSKPKRPIDGHIKEARGFRRFSMRGAAKAHGEWRLLCTVHNLLKLRTRRA